MTVDWRQVNDTVSLRARRSLIRILARAKTCSPQRPELPWCPPSLLFNVHPPTFPVAKQPDSPPRAEVKNEWSYTSPPPTCRHDVDRNKVTFYSLTYVCIFYPTGHCCR